MSIKTRRRDFCLLLLHCYRHVRGGGKTIQLMKLERRSQLLTHRRHHQQGHHDDQRIDRLAIEGIDSNLD